MRRRIKMSSIMMFGGVLRWSLVEFSGREWYWFESISKILHLCCKNQHVLCLYFWYFFVSWIRCVTLTQRQKTGLGVVCALWEQLEATMVVVRDDFWRNVAVAAAKTIPKFIEIVWWMLPCPIQWGRAAIGNSWGVIDFVSRV
jgi:hypothetical protein